MSKPGIIIIIASLALGGCMSAAPRAPQNWAIEFWRANQTAADEADGAAKSGTVRVASVAVRAPYDGTRLAVLRSDGTLAFDAYNAFAAAPAQMLRGAVQDAVEASGAFSRVVPANSVAACDMTLETTVTRLALDCRNEGRRDATVEVSLLLSRGRDVVAAARAEGKAPTGDNDYSAAFSRALARAVGKAMEDLAKWDSSQQ